MRWYYPALLLAVLLGVLFLRPAIVGYTISHEAAPGSIHIKNLNLDAPRWTGVYGRLSAPGNASLLARPGEVYNITIEPACQGVSAVYFSTSPSPNIAQATNMTAIQFDLLHNLTSTEAQSGNTTFNETHTFSVMGRSITTASARTIANHAGFQVGILQDATNDTIYVGAVVTGGSDFKGGISDFQAIMLAVNGTTYFTFTDDSVCPVEEAEPPVKKHPYLFPGRRANATSPIISFPDEEPIIPPLPTAPPTSPPVSTPVIVPEVEAVQIDGGYALDITLRNLLEDITVADVHMEGDATKAFLLRDSQIVFSPNKVSRIILDQAGLPQPGTYSGQIIFSHPSLGTVTIPFEIVVPGRASFDLTYLVGILISIVAVAFLLSLRRKKRNVDSIGASLDRMEGQMRRLTRKR